LNQNYIKNQPNPNSVFPQKDFYGAANEGNTSSSYIEIKILFNTKIYIFHLSEDLKPVFKIKDLKQKCCNYWEIPSNIQKNFHITNQILVFNKNELLINIYKSVFEGIIEMTLELEYTETYLNKDKYNNGEVKNKNTPNNYHHYLLTSSSENESDFLKNKQISTTDYNHSNVLSGSGAASKQIKKTPQKNHNKSSDPSTGIDLDRILVAELGLYVDEVLIQEKALEFILGNEELEARRKQEQMRLEKEFEKEMAHKRQQEKEDGYDEDEEEKKEREKMEKYKKADEIERGLESYTFRYYSSSRKMKEIIVTQHDLFLLRLRSLGWLLLYVMFICFLFQESQMQSANNAILIEISEVVKKRIFVSEYYKNFVVSQIDFQEDLTPNFLFDSKRDFNIFFGFVLNNIISKNSADAAGTGSSGNTENTGNTEKIGSFSALDKYGYNLVNTVRFTTKYAQLGLRPEDAIDKKFFSGLFPITEEVSEVNEITSNFDLKISDLLSKKIIEEKNLKRIFPEVVTTNANAFTNSTSAKDTENIKIAYNLADSEPDVERVVRSYSENGYQFYLILDNFKAQNYDTFSRQIMQYMISKPNFKYLKMMISFYNPVMNSMISLNLVIEVLSIGFFASSFDLNVINIPNDSGGFYSVISFTKLYATCFLVFFLLKLFFCIFAEKRIKSDKTLISREKLVYDFVCIFVYILYVTLENVTSAE